MYIHKLVCSQTTAEESHGRKLSICSNIHTNLRNNLRTNSEFNLKKIYGQIFAINADEKRCKSSNIIREAAKKLPVQKGENFRRNA